MRTTSLLLLCLSAATFTSSSPARCGQQQHSKCRKEPPGFFERSCETYFDCKYQPNPDATDPPSVYFKCDNSKCACELFGIMREEFGQMAVGWDRRSKRCSASLGGMCGRQDGIEVFCDRGYECVNSKCEKVASLEKEEGCKNKQGCEFGQADPPCPDPNGCEFGRAPPATTVDYGMLDRASGEEDPKINEVQPGDGGRRRPADSPPPPPSPATSCEVTNSCEAAEPLPEPEGEQRFYRFDKGDPPGYGSNDKEQQNWAPAWAPLQTPPSSRSRHDRKALPSRPSRTDGVSVEKSRLRSYTKGRYQSSEEDEEQDQLETSRRSRSEWRDREFRTSDRSTPSRRDHRTQSPSSRFSNSRSKGDDSNRRRSHDDSSEEQQVRDDRHRSRTYEPTTSRREHDKGQYSNGRDYERHGRSRSSGRNDDRTKSSRSAPEDFGEDPGITFTYRGSSSSSRSNNRRETQTSCGSKGGCGGGGSKGDRRPSSGGCDKCGGSSGGSGTSSKRPSSCGSKGCKGGSNNRPEREDREGGSSSGDCGNKGACTTPKPHWSMPKPKENEGCGGSCGGGGSKGSSDRGSSCGSKGCGKKTTTERPSGSCGGGSCGGRRGSGGSGGGGGHNFRPKTTARPRLPCGPENGCQKPKEEETSCEDNPESAGCGDDKESNNSKRSSEDGCSGGNKGGCSGSREEKMAPPSTEDDEMPCKKTNSCEEEADSGNSSKCDKCGSAYNFYRYMNNSNPSPSSPPPKTSGNSN